MTNYENIPLQKRNGVRRKIELFYLLGMLINCRSLFLKGTLGLEESGYEFVAFLVDVDVRMCL